MIDDDLWCFENSEKFFDAHLKKLYQTLIGPYLNGLLTF